MTSQGTTAVLSNTTSTANAPSTTPNAPSTTPNAPSTTPNVNALSSTLPTRRSRWRPMNTTVTYLSNTRFVKLCNAIWDGPVYPNQNSPDPSASTTNDTGVPTHIGVLSRGFRLYSISRVQSSSRGTGRGWMFGFLRGWFITLTIPPPRSIELILTFAWMIGVVVMVFIGMVAATTGNEAAMRTVSIAACVCAGVWILLSGVLWYCNVNPMLWPQRMREWEACETRYGC
ncbi:hypothetical protein CC1G_11007 [Coprinopsis cinerea okayama7|uniref:Uncharacterized protein n=1 Tax=Coprinopsis cinerea (strain Okayama-7 / 130 / ATCC MYA-4618 / FGSC 9003) TaxID=240176 RepID=A8P738_COPC7|nr:hypothetical protein CC1G_11007 [Coprinopsis cinerea okayama7\|eukprot:XP_001839285.2 hypothetical protein CC1G_11007 [Coprinopsis cinerea okayama7\